MKNFKSPPLLLFIFLRFYLFLRAVGITRLPKVKGLFNFLYNKVKKKEGIIRMRTLNGTDLYIDLSDKIISSKLLQYGYWEKGLTDLVLKTIKPGMVVLDVGAHIGYYSTLFAKLVQPDGKILSFEPDPHNFFLLKKNMELSHSSDYIVENLAISDSKGEINLYLEDENLGGHSIIRGEESGNSISVSSVTLDGYLGANAKVDFMKIDIEGAESLALRGAAGIIENNPNLIMVLEFNPNNMLETKNNPNVFLDQIRSYGFKIFSIDNRNGDLKEYKNNQDLIALCGNGLINIFCSRYYI